jgi:hypothetical protein
VPRLTLLLPESRHLAGTPLPPKLAKALGRADRATGQAGSDAQLARHFRLLPDRWSHAALTRAADGDVADTAAHAWLRADPAWIRPDINGARLMATGPALGIGQDDVAALLPALRPLFGDAGVLLDAPSPSRWYLRLPRESRLPAFTAPADALGDDVFEHAPVADARDAPALRRWRTLDSEAQVVLHNHPHNQARAAAGKAPVNALWFWGGGLLPDAIEARSPTLYSDDVLLHGIARVGTLDAMPLHAFHAGPRDVGVDALVDARALRDPQSLVADWLVPIAAAAATGEVAIDLADGLQFTLRPGQRWRVWRGPATFPA